MTQKLVVLGAGPMGLAAAYQALKRGYDVEVVEAGDCPGGMAAHFDFDGLSIERFYHFSALSDADTFEILGELGLSDKMKWVSTKMGLFYQGRLYRWGDPISLLTFPKMGPIAKLRYGLQTFAAIRRKAWRRLDAINAETWFVGWLGRRTYDQLWKPMLDLKFHNLQDQVSAAWMWQRINRLGRSRASLFEERLGYIDGGSETLMKALAQAIIARGGRIRYSEPAQRICVENGAVRGVETKSGQIAADRVMSTVPTPYVPALLPDDLTELKARYARIKNIAVVCVIHKLKRSVSPNFWTNVIDPRFKVPGIIEFSRLRPLPETIVYVPYYLPSSDPRFSAPDADFIDESWRCIQAINPELTEADRLSSTVGRLRFAQPIYEPQFGAILPPVQTPIKGLQIADTAFYYPEDRGVSESFRFAKLMVEALGPA